MASQLRPLPAVSPLTPARKIDPTRRPDGTPADNDRVEIGPTPLAFEEWSKAGLAIPQLTSLRQFRLDRLVQQLRRDDLGGVLLFDPLNIRYATDTTNMQVWGMHNMFRACFVSLGGHVIVWDYKPSTLLTGFNELVNETRAGASFFYFANGDACERDAHRFAAEMRSVLDEHAGKRARLGIDKIMIEGLRALEAQAIEVVDGERTLERARSVKGPDEILAMRCAMHACEQSISAMAKSITPGVTENDVWSVLHAQNIRRGGEWIETRLLSSGPRTNPWFQECGPRVMQAGELLAFDSDLVGCYGMCCDISRTWLIGDGDATDEQRRLFREAQRQIEHNMATLAPGKKLSEAVADFRPLPAEFKALSYSCAMHGVGLCDEWPLVKYQHEYRAEEFDLTLEPGMMFCVEAYIGAPGGAEGVKLEEQVLITETGVECLSTYPYDERLSGFTRAPVISTLVE